MLVGRGFGSARGKEAGAHHGTRSITLSAEGLPSQYAFVPSVSVMSLGVMARFLANAGYVSFIEIPAYAPVTMHSATCPPWAC